MTREALTPSQRAVLDYIRRHRDAHGYPPTLREIGRGAGRRRALNCVVQLCNVLERKGYIARIKGAPRTIRVIDPA